MVAQSDVSGSSEVLSRSVVSKLFWRIIPLLFLLVMLNYIDRSNLGFAALQMNGQLGFTPQVYGTGASIFFIGYLCAQIPANLLTHKFGARRMIAWIMVAWGLVAAAMALISDTTSFYTLRFLLAIAEAGMIPGATLYISQWFPQSERGRAIGTLYTATAAAVDDRRPALGCAARTPGLARPQAVAMDVHHRSRADHSARALHRPHPQRRSQRRRLARRARARGADLDPGARAAQCRRAQRHRRPPPCWRIGASGCCSLPISASAPQFLSMVLWLPQIIRHLQNLRPFEIGLDHARSPISSASCSCITSAGIPTAPARARPM